MTSATTRAPAEPADTSRLAGGAGASVLGKLGGRGAHFATQIVLARLLGPSGFGVYAIGWALLRMGALLTPLGLDKGVLVFLSRGEGKRGGAVLRRALLVAAASGMVLGGVLFVLAPWLASDVFRDARLAAVLRVFAVAFPLIACLRVAAEATRVSQRMKYAIRSQDLAQPVANLAFIALGYVAGFALVGYVAAAVVSFGIGLALAIAYSVRLFPGLTRRAAVGRDVTRELLRYALPVAIATVATRYMVWLDRLFVGLFRTSADVGVYQTASQTALIFMMGNTGLESMFAPMIADLHRRGEPERVAELYRVATKWGLYLGVPLALVMAFFSREILVVAFGPAYTEGALALTLLAIGGWLGVGSAGVSTLLLMTRHERRWLAVSGWTLGANVLLNLLLVPPLGVTGAAVATAATQAVLLVLSILAARRSMGLLPFDRRYMKGVVATLATAGLLLVVHRTFHATDILRLLFAPVVAYGGFLAVLLVLGVDREERTLLRDIHQAVRDRLGRSAGLDS